MRILRTAERTAAKPAGKVANVLVAAALALGMTFGVGAQALAPDAAYAAGKDYTYTVRIFSGQQGTFVNNDTCMVFTGVKAGEGIPFNQGNVYLKDADKYYVKGWKLAGKDDVTKNYQNNDSLLLSSVTVQSDMDLVVCYGVLVDSVGYTVRYVDQAGNELLPTESFYGNVGDSPVLAYRYIEGYLPQAYNLTGELYRDPAQNVYTFTYTPLAVPEQPTEQLPTVVTPVVAPAAGAAGGAAPAEPVTPEDAPAVAVPEPTPEELINDDGTPLAQPADVEDIRDDETPMASLNSLARSDAPSEDAGMLFGQSPLILGLGIGLFVVIAAGIVFFLVYKNRESRQRKMVATAASQAIASGYTVHPDSLAEEDVDISYNPLNNQAGYADPTQQYASPATNTQQYAVQPDAQQFQAPYADQQYGNTQYGGQINGQYDQYGQYNPQFGAPDDQ